MRKGITVDHVSFWVDFTRFNVNIRGFSESQCRRTMGLVLEASFGPRILTQSKIPDELEQDRTGRGCV